MAIIAIFLQRISLKNSLRVSLQFDNNRQTRNKKLDTRRELFTRYFYYCTMRGEIEDNEPVHQWLIRELFFCFLSRSSKAPCSFVCKVDSMRLNSLVTGRRMQSITREYTRVISTLVELMVREGLHTWCSLTKYSTRSTCPFSRTFYRGPESFVRQISAK